MPKDEELEEPLANKTEPDPQSVKARGGCIDQGEVEAWFEDRAHGICPPLSGKPRYCSSTK